MDPDLTLEKAITSVRQSEAIKQQQSTLHSQPDATNSIAAISRGGAAPRHKQFSHNKRHLDSSKSCNRCGKSPPLSREQCPPKEATCKRYHKKGHFQTVCRSKLKRMFEVEMEDEDTFLGAICDTGQSEPWTIQLSFNNSPLEFKIDTGADVPAIPGTKYVEKRDGPLQQTSKILKGPSKQLLKVRGFVTAKIAREGLETNETVYIIEGLQKPLVDHPAIQALGLVARIQTVDTSSQNRSVIEKFL